MTAQASGENVAGDQRPAVAAHTPGPWEANGKAVYGRGGHTGAVCVAAGKYRNLSQQLANARLIAAAPDMLAALQGAMVIIETMIWPEGAPRMAFDKRRAAILAAITKAEGL